MVDGKLPGPQQLDLRQREVLGEPARDDLALRAPLRGLSAVMASA